MASVPQTTALPGSASPQALYWALVNRVDGPRGNSGLSVVTEQTAATAAVAYRSRRAANGGFDRAACRVLGDQSQPRTGWSFHELDCRSSPWPAAKPPPAVRRRRSSMNTPGRTPVATWAVNRPRLRKQPWMRWTRTFPPYVDLHRAAGPNMLAMPATMHCSPGRADEPWMPEA